MSEPQVVIESLHFSVGILGIAGGSLLLLVNGYSQSATEPFIPKTAMGIILLLISSLLAYSGLRRSLSHSPLFVSLCLTISALWCGSGLISVLAGEGILVGETMYRNAMVPGLASFTVALLVIGVVGILQREVVLSIISFAVCLACAHEIVGLYVLGFSQVATAANYLLVCLIGAYFGFGRLLNYITKAKITLPGTGLTKKNKLTAAQAQDKNDMVIIGLVMNLLSASVFACRLLGVISTLFKGQVPWLWVAGLYQLGVCVLSYRAFDTLSATFYGFASVLKFAEGYALLLTTWYQVLDFPVAFPIVFSILFFTLALFCTQKCLLEGFYLLFYVSYCISIAAQSNGFFQAGAQGVQAAIFIASAFMLFIYLQNMASPWRIPTGDGVIKELLARTNTLTLRQHNKDFHAPYLGYSKYADAEVLGYGCSVLAAFAMIVSLGPDGPLGAMVLPWVVMAGGVLQLLSGSVAFARGKTLESTAFILYGIMWVVWGLTRYGGLYGGTRGFNVAVGIICFMLFNCFVIIGTLFLSKAWFTYSLSFEFILISFLLDAISALPFGYDIGITVIFGLVSFYCFVANLFNSSFENPNLPLGEPFIKLSGYGGGSNKCLHVPARKATSVRAIAEIMKNGGTCGMPSDTVYVLVAACNRPDAVEKAYSAKVHAEDRPMSLWISSIKQLEPVRHLINPILWDFMEAAWPSSISMVIPRGEWLDYFGLKHAAKYIGTPQSIAIRNPNCTVATHLMDLVGPIAVMSANPTGEADTTHHNQVYARLGNKVDGVLCDGPSPENIASTVVDCTKIHTGNIGFFRIGIYPRSQVLQLFQNVLKKHKKGVDNFAFISDIPEETVSPAASDQNKQSLQIVYEREDEEE
ncbi:uncharacterized protein si:ch211-153b23.4 [Polypterus senegalus]|uniref:uncharacterized protein si:ch211-153b23.4 n=1 Tax=Polypterus senegalus TaxID=55291 RepID=UPI001965BF67|nr:uncharacterized protein si:ch211-153b23.4 [Polypterus senegalus]